MFDLIDKRVLVTGASGFLGRHVIRMLESRGSEPIYTDGRWDFREELPTLSSIREESPDVVLHLAARCGGIGANMSRPGDFIVDNLRMGLNIIEACKDCEIRVVVIGTVCSYPEHNDRPIKESELWKGYPEPTNAPYGIAKRTLGEVLAAYHKQHGLKCAYPILANLYGLGDNFDPETSHVIPAMICKFTDARRDGIEHVTCWGTGEPTRDFLFVEDAAEAIIRVAERIESPEPINIGTGIGTSIKEIADRLAVLCGFNGNIRWNSTMPNGQMRRVLETTRQRLMLDWKPAVALDEGLRRTVEWWNSETRRPGEFRHKPGLFGVPDPIRVDKGKAL